MWEDGDNNDEETSVTGGPKLSAIRNSMDEIIAYIGKSSDPEAVSYTHLDVYKRQLLFVGLPVITFCTHKVNTHDKETNIA